MERHGAWPDASGGVLSVARGHDGVMLVEIVGWGADRRAGDRLEWVRGHPSPRWGWHGRARVRRPKNVGEVSDEETLAVAARKALAAVALPKFLGEDVKAEHLPVVALSFTGGGVRAMIHMLGVLMVAEEMGLLDCVTFSSSLSGSAWLQALWMKEAGPAAAAFERLRSRLRQAFCNHPLKLAGPPLEAGEEDHPAAPAACHRFDGGGEGRGEGGGEGGGVDGGGVEGGGLPNPTRSEPPHATASRDGAPPLTPPLRPSKHSASSHPTSLEKPEAGMGLGGGQEERQGVGFVVGQTLFRQLQEVQEVHDQGVADALRHAFQSRGAGGGGGAGNGAVEGEGAGGEAGRSRDRLDDGTQESDWEQMGREWEQAVAGQLARRAALDHLGVEMNRWNGWASLVGKEGGGLVGGASAIEFYGFLLGFAWFPGEPCQETPPHTLSDMRHDSALRPIPLYAAVRLLGAGYLGITCSC
ncbi:acyl transferase/acyl hydrolase/lysophospholipase [Baffinella frigidus]|nr:acyl transferase/acyl hydrolase/lysophospholipase [Cryptophyta sp. CCMP2293]